MKKFNLTTTMLLLFGYFSSQTILANESLSDLLKSSENSDLGYQLEFQINEQLPKFQFHLIRNMSSDSGSDNSGEVTINRIEVFKLNLNQVIQTITVNQSIPTREVDYYFETQDINFDGYQDIRLISSWGGTGNSKYHYWLYDVDTDMFKYNEEISNLDNPYPDPVTKTISTSWVGGKMGAIYEEQIYKLHSGVLIKLRQENQNWSEEKNHFIKIIKQFQNGKIENISEEIIKEEDA